MLGARFAFGQVPRIQRLSAVQVNIDHPAAHQFDERLVGISALQNRDQWPGTRHHQQLELRKEGFAATALRHDQHVGVAEPGIERRERYELAVGSFEQHQRRIRRPLPWHLHRQQVGGVQGQHVRLALVDFSQSRKAGEEEALLRQRLGNSARAVHARDGVQHALPAIGESSFRFFRLKAIAGWP